MGNISIKELELVYRNSETEEELKLALLYHGITMEQLFKLASDRGWESSPAAIKNIASSLDNPNSNEEVDEKYIEQSNKAAIRRLHTLLEYAVTKFHSESSGMSVGAMVDVLDVISKVREKLTKLELPLYGLSTMEPVRVANPIHVYLDTAPEEEENENP